jgi:protoheme IX farnesyltransferase
MSQSEAVLSLRQTSSTQHFIMRPNSNTSSFRRLALICSILVVGLIVLGGVVRITGSGMGCGDHWPLCKGRWFPPLDLPTLIEISHRFLAGLVTVAVVALGALAWQRHRQERYLRGPAMLAVLLMVVQVLLGPVIVKLELPPVVVVAHLINAMALLAVLVIGALRASAGPDPGPDLPPSLPKHPYLSTPTGRLGTFTAAFGFVVILFGALTANLQAGPYCLGFPLCEGTSGAPPATTQGTVQWIHRVLAFTFVALLASVALRIRRHRLPPSHPLRRAAALSLGLALVQILVAAVMVLQLFPPAWRGLHLLVGTVLWASLVVLVFRLGRTPVDEPVSNLVQRPAGAGRLDQPEAAAPSLLADLVTLTKPRIISLLLLTTVAAMFITGRGAPSLPLVLWVLLGGYLMAGGANTVNMWFDRDIDQLMGRTRFRPVASGRIPAWAALCLGIGQGAAAFLLFWYYVNPLAAGMALAGYLFYIFIYTIWLKRITPQNIVIGGAAGAFPPLVGWTAMTGSLDLPAIYLFAIIFFWTPPHFWALALVKQKEYARAGVPMMPVVAGERYTKVQMLIYTLLLIPLTLMPTVFGALGLFYGAVALALGAGLLWHCLRVLREVDLTPSAWRMYRFSLLYLALLFVAMGVDRAIPFGHQFEPAPVLLLNHPEEQALAPRPTLGSQPGHP